jgi:hypothetical protein
MTAGLPWRQATTLGNELVRAATIPMETAPKSVMPIPRERWTESSPEKMRAANEICRMITKTPAMRPDVTAGSNVAGSYPLEDRFIVNTRQNEERYKKVISDLK